MTLLPRVVIFPGLSCDARMVGPQGTIRARLEPQDWLSPRPEETLASYAARYVPLIDTSTPFYLAGVSFGGMIAQELATHLRPRGLILIASCRSSDGVPWVNRQLARLVAMSPDWFVKLGKLAMPRMRRVFGIEKEWQVELFRSMLREMPESLIKWSLRATIEWPGVEPTRLASIPTLQIHAERDHVLPLRLAGPVNAIVPKAGHALNVARGPAVNAIIDAWLSERDASACGEAHQGESA